MFTYAPVDCKSISSYEATNGVYHVAWMSMCGGGVGVCGDAIVWGDVCVSRDAFELQ